MQYRIFKRKKESVLTKLENLVYGHKKWLALGADASRQDRQNVLDKITVEVLSKLTSVEISRHTKEVYNATVVEYAGEPHNLCIIDELIEFMDMLPDEACVLDVGCGFGRDTFFMSVQDKTFRKGLMGRVSKGQTTSEKFAVPEKVFRVVGVDGSRNMIMFASKKKTRLIEESLLKPGPYPSFWCQDMHHPPSIRFKKFDGIWSCTALFTHTPHNFLDSSLAQVARVLKSNGLFFASYTNQVAGQGYNKLKLSGTGRIKYFSQPDPKEIVELARQHGLTLVKESFADFDFEVGGGVIQKNLFVSQFFVKS